MKAFYVVTDYGDEPSEGMNVVSKTLVDGLREAGRQVKVIAPGHLWLWLPRVFARRDVVVFTHGPGHGVVLASALLRRVTKMRIVWLATRPDLGGLPHLLRGRRTAHAVVGNRPRADLRTAAKDHDFIQQFIGIDPSRLTASVAGVSPWPELSATRKPVLLHVGHLRSNRGLDLLIEAKRLMRDDIVVVVQGSPTFEADANVLAQLLNAGIVVRRNFVPALADLYRHCDLYVFPARPESQGAIELPLSVLEAIACGRPVLSNDFGAIQEALGGVPGLHITTPEHFAVRVKELLSDPLALHHRPDSLPSHLHASRVVSAVLQASEDVQCA